MKLYITFMLLALGFALVASQCHKNEVPGCGKNCGKTCADYKRSKFAPKPSCPPCKGGGCECDTANDQWFNPTINRCIHGQLCDNYGR